MDERGYGMGKARKRFRVFCAVLMALVIVGTIAGFFWEPYFSDRATRAMLKDEDAYVTDTARSPWLYVDENGVATLNSDACFGMTEIVIPDAINGIRVTSFDMYFASPPHWVKKITFPKGMRAVGDFAFHQWSEIEEIVFKEGIEDLSNFYIGAKQKLKKLVLPRSVTALKVGFLDGANPALVVHFGGTEEEWLAMGRAAEKVLLQHTVVFLSEG